jgi:hypothetical protein
MPLATLHIPERFVLPLAMTAAAIVLLYIASRLIRRRARQQRIGAAQEAEQINLADYEDGDVPTTGMRIDLYNVPVRLVLIVVAPVGRGAKLPHRELWPAVLDQAIPGLRHVIETHETEIRAWPAQLSTSGFREKFFQQASLPNDRGKGSMWSEAAGCFSALGQRFLIGILVRAEETNSLGQFSVERDSQWLDLFRIHMP